MFTDAVCSSELVATFMYHKEGLGRLSGGMVGVQNAGDWVNPDPIFP